MIKTRNLSARQSGGLEVTTKYFFDRQTVIRMVDRVERRAMTRIGGFTRTTARRSMRASNRSRPYSAPGEAPRYHTKLIRDKIFFSYSPSRHSVVVGPERISIKSVVKPVSEPTVPALLEYGGRAIATSSTFALLSKPVVTKSKSGKKRKRRFKTIPPGPRKYKERPAMRNAFALAISEPKLKESWSIIS